MPANNAQFLSAEDLDFFAIRESLKTYLQSQDRFRDYNFEGSNMSVLLDVLALNTYKNGFYLNMVGSEMFLDTAQLLDSAFSHAKELNYVPRSRSSARAVVTFTVDTHGETPGSVVIPRFHRMTAQGMASNGQPITFTFSTNEAIVVERNAIGAYVSGEVLVYEGNIVKEVFVANVTSRYVLQSANIDTSSLSVVVQTSNSVTTNSEFDRADSLYGIGPEDEVYFLQGAYDGRYEICFGDGNMGRAIIQGNLIRATYRDSSGPDGNYVDELSSGQVDSYDITVTIETPSYGGSEREGVAGIQFFAPRHFTTQERAVTKYDFINLVREKFPQLEAVTAYGGEEVTPKQYGKVILSVKPWGDTVITDSLKNEILSYITGKNIVTEPIIQDADFLYLAVDSEVQYDPLVTNLSISQIEHDVQTAILAYSNTNLNDFGLNLKSSRLFRAIDDSNDAIQSNDTKLRLFKKWQPDTSQVEDLVFSFDNPLRVETRNADPLYHDPIVYSSPFVYLKNAVQYTAIVQDDGNGTMFIYALQDDGSRVVIEPNVGTVDYETGDVSISINVYGYDSLIKVYGVPESYNIEVRANVFLTLDDDDINITVEAVTEER